jgi:GNAT superfamily N-acetyltransferase
MALPSKWTTRRMIQSAFANFVRGVEMVITFKTKMPLDQTMEFELQYHENLRFDLEEKEELLQNAITVWMFIDGELAGESYGISFGVLEEEIEGCKEFFGDSNIIYCYSNTTLPKFQNKGLGTILKAYWLGLAKAKGFTTVIGHARPNDSQSLAKKFGAVMGEVFPNWYETGEDYQMYRQEL